MVFCGEVFLFFLLLEAKVENIFCCKKAFHPINKKSKKRNKRVRFSLLLTEILLFCLVHSKKKHQTIRVRVQFVLF